MQKICELIHRYKNINNKVLDRLDEWARADPFEAYAQIIFYFCEYLQNTTQSYHATLNQDKMVLWICEDSKDQPRESKLG